MGRGPTGVIKSVLDTSRSDGKGRDEIFVDIVEKISCTFSAGGYLQTGQIDGAIQARCFLHWLMHWPGRYECVRSGMCPSQQGCMGMPRAACMSQLCDHDLAFRCPWHATPRCHAACGRFLIGCRVRACQFV